MGRVSKYKKPKTLTAYDPEQIGKKAVGGSTTARAEGALSKSFVRWLRMKEAATGESSGLLNSEEANYVSDQKKKRMKKKKRAKTRARLEELQKDLDKRTEQSVQSRRRAGEKIDTIRVVNAEDGAKRVKPKFSEIEEGETLEEYKWRIRHETKAALAEINHQVKVDRVTRPARKRFLEKKKEVGKKRKWRQMNGGTDEDFEALRDNVQFGEVAPAPPNLDKFKQEKKTKTKAGAASSGGVKATGRKKAGGNGAAQTNAAGPKSASAKEKLKARQLEIHRQRVLQRYAASKKRKLNPKPGAASASSDDDGLAGNL